MIKNLHTKLGSKQNKIKVSFILHYIMFIQWVK